MPAPTTIVGLGRPARPPGVPIAAPAFVRIRVGLDRAAWLSAATVVCGLAVCALLGPFGYGWVALALLLTVLAAALVGWGFARARRGAGAAARSATSSITSVTS